MRLARAGHKVLRADRASFLSDQTESIIELYAEENVQRILSVASP